MKKILCPIDFSENSIEAARFAIRFTQLAGSQLKFFYVSSVVVPAAGDVEVPVQQLRLREEELEEQINRLYHEVGIDRNSQNVSCETQDYVSITHGIAEEAGKYGADLIIMGTTGASGLKRFLIGSVTTSVIDLVSCPVLAVPADFGEGIIKRIGMATEVTNVHKEIIDAVVFARIYHADLELFHVGMHRQEGHQLAQELRDKTGYANITFVETPEKYEGDVIGGLNAFVEQRNPDVLIMHHVQRNWFEKLITGSRTKDMLFHSNAAILTFNHEKEKG
jgi:nucleotide-binding universal stress UspA family protein